MKFLLVGVNAKYIHSNPAIYSLQAYVGRELQKYVEIAEYTINHYTRDILADIYKRKPEVLGFSCYIWNWKIIQELLAELPKILPDTDIWLGGPEVTYDAPVILQKYPQIKGIMVGEGEETFKELLENYVNGKEKESEQIAGLCLATGYTSIRELTDISELPFLYDDLEHFQNRIIYYESSRGCPYRCSYCLSSIDKRVRLRNIDRVKEELRFFLDRKVPQVKFVDRTFNCNHDHAMAIWQYIYDNDNGVTNFHFEISADILREDEIALLQKFRPGLVQLEIGVQSVNEDTLKAIHRVMDVSRLEQIVRDLKEKNNLHLHLDLIAGLPFENYKSFGESFDKVYRMEPEQLQLGFLKVLKGSEMQERAEEFGICYLDVPPYEVLYTKWLSYSEVLRLKRVEEMVELYYNSNQFTHTLPFLLQVFESPFAMYEALADYYEQKGYFVSSPARVYRYRILLEFALGYDAGQEAVYKELLTYDMYLRENVKSRPEFATDMSENYIKQRIRDFYRKEENRDRKFTHIEPFYFPVWDHTRVLALRSSEDKKGETPEFVLFDYKERSPLTYEAGTRVVKTEEQLL